MSLTIVLPFPHAETIERAAGAARPLEYCAALIGKPADRYGVMLVTAVVRLRNADARPGRFAVSDAELDQAHAVARERGVEVIALLHSHPTGTAEPSRRDRAALTYARYPWAIAALGGPGEVRFAAFAAGTGLPLPVRVAQQLAG